MKRCGECGRPAWAVVIHNHKKRSRRARARQPAALAGHDLCQRCWESLWDKNRAASQNLMRPS